MADTLQTKRQELEFGAGPGLFKWIDYEAPDPQQVDDLGREFGFHPLTIEDAKTFDQRAKLQDYGDYLFLSLHALGRADSEIDDREIEIFLGAHYLVSIHREPLDWLTIVQKRVGGDAGHPQAGPDYLLYFILEQIVERIFPILDSVDEEIDQLEDEMVERATPQTLQRIFHLKQMLIKLRRSIGPMREVVNGLAGNRYVQISAQAGVYFRDVYDHLARIYELIETERDLLGSALDTYLSVVSNRLNEVMKRLTIIATIFLPISFLAGVGGMNFQQFPFRSDLVYGGLVLAMVGVPALMLFYFYRQGWL